MNTIKPERRENADTVVSSLPAAVQEETLEQAYLVVIYGADLGRRIPLGTAEVECGRALETGIPLDDESASRRHARFVRVGSTYRVADLGSTNGTRVNDATVSESVLRDGDQVKVGRTIFKFICGGNVELSYHEEIYRLMTFDGLTQLHNKRSFDATIEREVSRSARYRRPLSLVIFDIDHFKQINDRLGHLAGDVVLQRLAALAAGNVRREDTLARVGGEEFALIAPEVPLDGAIAAAEKLRALVAKTPFRLDDRHEGGAVPVTASFGVAVLGLDPPMSATELYAAADARLYAAKEAGRNRVA